MKILLWVTMIPCFLSVLCYNSIASELSYTCKIVNVYEIDEKGSLRTSNWDKQFKDSEFSVSRVTGEIIGEVMPTLLAESTEVIHKGNKEYSFKT